MASAGCLTACHTAFILPQRGQTAFPCIRSRGLPTLHHQVDGFADDPNSPIR
ncbi:MAG: hypothetical protein V2G49_08730 [bacterium JZ-2024 1]